MEIFDQPISLTEFWGTLTGILGVVLTARKNIWCYPAGLVNVGLYAVVFFQSRLYSDAVLQIFYIILLVYGWIQWKKNSAQKEFVATRIENKLWIKLSVVCAASTLVAGAFFMKYTDAALPFLDALLTSMSLVAQWLVAKKKIENWLIWIAADVIYVGMYIFKHLYLTAFLYFVFIAIAIAGWNSWKKNLVTLESAH